MPLAGMEKKDVQMAKLSQMWRLYAPHKTVSDLKLLLDKIVLHLNYYIKPEGILIDWSLSDEFSEHWYIFPTIKKAYKKNTA